LEFLNYFFLISDYEYRFVINIKKNFSNKSNLLDLIISNRRSDRMGPYRWTVNRVYLHNGNYLARKINTKSYSDCSIQITEKFFSIILTEIDKTVNISESRID
jgi:hypothetical protein